MIDAAAPADQASSFPVHSFTTAPAPGSSTPFTWLMAADVGQAEPDGSDQTISNKPGALGVGTWDKWTGSPACTRGQRSNSARNSSFWLSTHALGGLARVSGARPYQPPNFPVAYPLQTLRVMAKQAAALQPRLVTYTGDISYSDGTLGDWELFMDNAAEVLATTPVLVQEGNHERDS